MAQKYDLALVNTLTGKKIRGKAWYKERLQTKFLKNKNPGDISKTLIGSQWTFIKDGLDDFRDGLPPNIQGDTFIEGNKGPSPAVIGETGRVIKDSVNNGRFTKYQTVYSNSTPQQQMKREHIDEIEYGLLQHPLALYPHLEECLPPDLFEDVVDVLDPEMNMGSDEEDEEFEDEFEDMVSELPPMKKTDKPESTSTEKDDDNEKIRNTYRWLPRKEEASKDDKKSKGKRAESPSEDSHIKKVTRDFTDWVASLGGESNNVEESTIHSLFASGYETKPALSVPIHVVELSNVPPELRMSATVTPAQSALPHKNLEQIENSQQEMTRGHMNSNEKYKYGAWYLDTKLWKRKPVNEPLEDPKDLKDKEMSDSKKKSMAMDEELAPLHGAKAFKDFIEKKHTSTRVPEFLNRVSDFQEKASQETTEDKGPN